MIHPIGVDLGTTYSAAAYVDEDGVARLLVDEDGHGFVPSVVLFEDDGVHVGDIAKDNAVVSPERVVSCVKRYMGDSCWRFEYGGHYYTPEEISSFILKRMKAIAERTLGPVTQAVVTVPAYFLDAERRATIKAAQMAGLDVLKIINEPTAAALSYGFLEERADLTFLVYDLGGGTFDVTVMRSTGGTDFEMITTAGNHRLGGYDWDTRIRDYVAEQFLGKHCVDPRDDQLSDASLYAKAEQAKIALSQAEKARVTCQHAGKSLTVELTRSLFEKLTEDLLQLTTVEVDRAMQEAHMTPSHIDLVLLVGGSSKMPMVHELMKSKARALKMSRNPDQSVALGAAIEAARLMAGRTEGQGLYKLQMAKRLGGIEVQDVTPHSLGMIALDRGALRNTVIIPKGTKVPCQQSRDDYVTARDDQDTLTVHLVQGEVEDPEACVPMATYDFQGIPPRPAGESRIRVSYRYNDNTVVEVSATDIKSGKALSQVAQPLVDLSSLVDQTCPDKGRSATRSRRSVVLLIDSSGSMSGESLADAKRACYQFIEQTNFEFVRMGLVQFGIESRASEWHPLCAKAGPLKKAVDRLHADGGTPMAEAIECGMEMLGSEPKGVERFVVLFTDGAPNDRRGTLDAAQRAKQTGIEVICVGVPGADTGLLNELASSSENNFFAETGKKLVDTFGNLAQVISGKRV